MSSRKPSAVDRLSDYDDICTDILIDKVEFWSEIHKMAKHYKGKRKVTEREVLDVIRDLVRENTSLCEASEKLIKYPYSSPFSRRFDGLKPWVTAMSADDRTEFSKYASHE
jgi:Txe/YoeB family toxin of Txe-Axe toxin-antitoxin module